MNDKNYWLPTSAEFREQADSFQNKTTADLINKTAYLYERCALLDEAMKKIPQMRAKRDGHSQW